MKNYTNYLLICAAFLLHGCKNESNSWAYTSTIDLGNTTPIGLTALDQQLWVADGDNNRLIHLDKSGNILSKHEDFERPMHIGSDGKAIYIPEYGKDQITLLKGSERALLPLSDSLDAPAGVHFADGMIAIADFYNHRVLFNTGAGWESIGKEGKADGEFYYPTDVHLAHQKLYVADAYNNRVQVFDLDGNFIQSIGKEEEMNASTGIYVEEDVYVTDFENDRVLIYTLDGQLKQILVQNLDKPTDIYILDNLLYIANYKGKNLVTYQKN